jgi:hypothetical protein
VHRHSFTSLQQSSSLAYQPPSWTGRTTPQSTINCLICSTGTRSPVRRRSGAGAGRKNAISRSPPSGGEADDSKQPEVNTRHARGRSKPHLRHTRPRRKTCDVASKLTRPEEKGDTRLGAGRCAACGARAQCGCGGDRGHVAPVELWLDINQSL